jgi:pectinesterase
VDFIFGRGTAVFDGCAIKYITTRGKKGSTIFAPSTENAHPFGILAINSALGSDSGAANGSTYLGRDWVDSGGNAPNGQLVIRESTLDATIRGTAPWGSSTKGEAFNAARDRLFEYKNTGPGAAP